MTRKILITLMTFIASASVAQATPLNKSDLLKLIAADPVGAAALNTASAEDCSSEVTTMPSAPFTKFAVLLSCDDSKTSEDTGGVYLQILIEGLYYDQGDGEVQSVRLFRAG